MRFVRYGGGTLGLLTGDGNGVVDLTDRLDLERGDTLPEYDDPLLKYIDSDADASAYEGVTPDTILDLTPDTTLDLTPDTTLDQVRLEAPIAAPGKIVAAPSNYADHQAEMSGGPTAPPKGYFLKAPSNIVGPGDTVELPFADRQVDHEIELAFVMAEDVEGVPVDEALEAVFGYTVLLDISVRGDEDRSNRKSYDTFTVVGPCVATPDEIGDPQDLRMRLHCNGDRRQDSNTEHMILSCAEFVSFASTGTTIEAGDLVTTGTPSGVDPLADGDVIDAAIEDIGSLTVDVRQRDVRHEGLDGSG